MNLQQGCTVCQRLWGKPDSEGQCNRCKRCLHCCGTENAKYTCAWRFAQKTPEQVRRSDKARETWENQGGRWGTGPVGTR